MEKYVYIVEIARVYECSNNYDEDEQLCFSNEEAAKKAVLHNTYDKEFVNFNEELIHLHSRARFYKVKLLDDFTE